MEKKHGVLFSGVLAVLLTVLILTPGTSRAHCDGMDGPVVTAAQKALETGDVNHVLIWVQKKDEGVVQHAFEQTLVVRKLNPSAKELADLYFFETLVRIHRAGEGAPYTGLKPAARDLGPAVPAADKALTDGKLEPLYKLLTSTIHDELHEKFEKAVSKKAFDVNNVKAGREFIEAYVIYIHYVERLYEAAARTAHGHYTESTEEHAH